jgi:urea transporter
MYVIEQTKFIPTKTQRIAKIDNNRTELVVAILHRYSQILLSNVAVSFF